MVEGPPFVPEAVIFDLDGLLVDSEDAWGEAERRVVLGYGKPWDPAVRTLLLGRGPDDAAGVLAEYVGVPDRREVARRMLQEAVREFRLGIPPRAAAAELVAVLHGRVPLGVATNSRRVLAELSLDASGLASFFEVVVCVEDVVAPKPAPDPYRRACEQLGANAARSVALEDSPVGAVSAKAAGMWVIGCPSFEGTVLDAADVVVMDLGEVDAEGLLGQPARRLKRGS